MKNIQSLHQDMLSIRKKSPLIHNITNYVVANSTANALLAIGASPVMSHALEEVEEMVGLASALVLNIGTLDENTVNAMVLAGTKAQELGVPMVLDPVGAGATSYRTKTALALIDVCKPQVIRGNASEIMALVDCDVVTKGVDSMKTSGDALEAAKLLAKGSGAVVVVSGSVDYITDGHRVSEVAYGDPLMSRVTGLGCTSTAVIGAFLGVNKDCYQAAWHGMLLMGFSGEVAAKQAKGNGSMQMAFIDALFLNAYKQFDKLR